MYEPPLLAAVTLVAPPARTWRRAVYLREGGRRPAAGTFMLRTWTGYQNKVAWQGIRTQITRLCADDDPAGLDSVTAPNGGSVSVLPRLPVTQCDVSVD